MCLTNTKFAAYKIMRNEVNHVIRIENTKGLQKNSKKFYGYMKNAHSQGRAKLQQWYGSLEIRYSSGRSLTCKHFMQTLTKEEDFLNEARHISVKMKTCKSFIID